MVYMKSYLFFMYKTAFNKSLILLLWFISKATVRLLRAGHLGSPSASQGAAYQGLFLYVCSFNAQQPEPPLYRTQGSDVDLETKLVLSLLGSTLHLGCRNTRPGRLLVSSRKWPLCWLSSSPFYVRFWEPQPGIRSPRGIHAAVGNTSPALHISN